MKCKTAIYFAVAALSLAALFPAPATAQAELPAYEIVTIIRSAGLDPLGRPVRRGPAYVLRALDAYGQEVTVAVDARQGRILSVRPVMPVAAPYGPPGQAYVPPPYSVEPPYAPQPYYPGPEFESDDGYEPIPPGLGGPRVIYAPRAFNDVPRPPARVPSPKGKSASTIAPLPKAAPERSAAAKGDGASELTTGSSGTAKQPEASDPLAAPPVQALE